MASIKTLCPEDDLSDLFLIPDCGFDNSKIQHQPSKPYTLEFGGDKEVWVELLGADRFLFGDIEMITNGIPNEDKRLEFHGSDGENSATIFIPECNWAKAVELYLKYGNE